MNKNQTIVTCVAVALFLLACSIEDPSVVEFDLQKIRFNGNAPFNAYLDEPEQYIHAEKQANLFYTISNGDTMKVSVCEFEDATLAKAFFYTSDSIVEKIEILTESERKRFFRHGRRVFIFSYRFSISHNSPLLDSLFSFTKKFPAADTSTNSNFCNFSLKNTRADEDLSMQRKNFLGIEIPFNMQVRRYRDAEFSWACACSTDKVSEKDWANYKTKWQENFYGSDSTALIGRLSNGIAVAVYGDLDKKRMHDVYKEFTALIK